MKLRKLFAGVAAAATLLSGFAFGATASAADPTVDADANGVVTSNATFTFTAASADQWGTDNNRVIKAYKLGNFVQTGDAANGYIYTVATPADPASAKATLQSALDAALKGKGENGADVTVPANEDPLAWALQNNWLDSSSAAPYVADDAQADNAGVTRKLADALQTEETKDEKLATPDFAVTTLKVNADATNGEVALNAVEGSDNKSYSASLPAGFYLFLDVTEDTNNKVTDGVVGDQNESNADQKKGGVIVNSAPMILSSGELGTDTKAGQIVNPIASNTVNFKNHVTPVTKSHNDADNSVSEGQTVTYTLNTTVPAFTTGYENYAFSLTDTPGAGQTIDLNVIKVTIDGTEVKPYDATNNATGYELTEPDATTHKFDADGAKSFTVDLTKFVQARQYDATKSGAVVVTYNATITAKKDPVTNKVEVKDNGKDAKAEDTTNLTLGGFSFTKNDAEGHAITSKDATFAIAAKAGADPTAKDGNGAVTPTTNTATSDENGKVTFEGLADGVYTVTETGTPAGFLSAAKASFEVTIKGGKAVYFHGTDAWKLAEDSGNANLSGGEIDNYAVKNVKTITQLPLTGAAGIGLFAVVALLLAGAGVTVVAKSRSTKRMLHA